MKTHELNHYGEQRLDDAMQPILDMQMTLNSIEQIVNNYAEMHSESIYEGRWQDHRHLLPMRTGKPLGDIIDTLRDALQDARGDLPCLDKHVASVSEALVEERVYRQICLD